MKKQPIGEFRKNTDLMKLKFTSLMEELGGERISHFAYGDDTYQFETNHLGKLLVSLDVSDDVNFRSIWTNSRFDQKHIWSESSRSLPRTANEYSGKWNKCHFQTTGHDTLSIDDIEAIKTDIRNNVLVAIG